MVDDNPFFSESALKTVFGHYGIGYEYGEDKVYIGEKKETEKLPLSQAEVYEQGDKFSASSGVRKDKDGNEFSGLLVTDYQNYGGYVSYFTNGKYNKISGVIHVAAETDNDAASKIQISKMDEKGDFVPVYTTPKLTKLSEPMLFSTDIGDSKVIKIEQISLVDYAIHYKAVEAVISEAYFYNE